MIRVTSTLIVHRPERLLYYLPEPTEEVKNCIADGVCPDELQKYQYAFGTYDEAGVFYLPESMQREIGNKWVIGIEYRKDDINVALPVELPCVVLPACDVIIQDITYEYRLNEELLEEIIRYAKKEKNERSSPFLTIYESLFRKSLLLGTVHAGFGAWIGIGILLRMGLIDLLLAF